MSRSVVLAFAALALALASTARAADPSTGTLSLDSVLAEVLAADSALAKARKDWESVRSRVAAARSWPDPMLALRRETMESLPRELKTEVELTQSVPFPGKPSAEAAMRRHEAMIAWQVYRGRALESLAGAKRAFYALERLDRTAEILESSVELLREVVRAAQARLASGKGEAGDAFLAQTELEEVKNLLFEARQGRRLAAAELNLLQGREPQAPVGRTRAPELRDLPEGLEAVLAKSRKASPDALAARHELDHASAMLRRARLGFAPDLAFSVMETRRSMGPRAFEVGAGVSLPLWLWRPAAELSSARRHREAAEAGTRAMTLDAATMVYKEYVETETHLALARNLRDVRVPLARGAMKVLQRGYEAGKTDLLKLVEGFRAFLRSQTEFEEEVYHYGEHWAELERAAGYELGGAGRVPGPEEGHEE